MITKTEIGSPLYITEAKLLDPTQKWEKLGEVLLAEGRILAVGKKGELAGKAKSIKATTLQARGACLSPGFIDLNCQIPDPGGEQRENFGSGSKAAARGGFTSICALPCTTPEHDNAFITDFISRRAKDQSLVRVVPVGAISAGREGKRLAEIGSMVAAGARACTDIHSINDSYLMRKALEYSKAFHVPIFSYPEDRSLVGLGVIHEGVQSNRLGLRGIPAAAEEIGLYRDLILAKHTSGRLHLSSITTSGAVRAIRHAREQGLEFTAETCPHYFSLTAEAISSYDTLFKCMPPLRTDEDCEALICALADGTLDCIATQHSPQSRSSKDVGFEVASSGILGLETCLGLSLGLWKKKRITLLRLVELLSSNPARVLGISEEWGNLRPKSRADLVLFDPDVSFTFREEHLGGLSRNSPFIGMKMQGKVRYTIVNGSIVYGENGNR